VPLKVLVDKLVNTRFEPSGITANANIRFATSVLDYIARWLGGRFLSSDYLKLNGSAPVEGTVIASMASVPQIMPTNNRPVETANISPRDSHEGAPTCSECGMLMVPNGACFKCENCGSTSGCS